MEYELIECEECEGTGEIEVVGYGCLMPAWNCCGGCVTSVRECEHCEGTGEIEIE